MKRSQKEYEEILNFIKSELLYTADPSNKPRTKELETRFNNWAKNNNIKPVGLRTIQNYISVLRDEKEPTQSNHNEGLNPYRLNNNKIYSTKSLQSSDRLEVERMELVQKILEPWEKVLPKSIKELAQPVKCKDKADYSALTVAHPRYQPKEDFLNMVFEFMSMIHRGKLCRFTYEPGLSDLDDDIEETPEGSSWLKEVYGMPLQLNIYLDRIYLCAYTLSKEELLDGLYGVHSSGQVDSPLKYAKISRFVLANINDNHVVALEKYVQDKADLGPLMHPIRQFQEQFKPTYILEAFSIPQIQEDIIGVVLPTEEQLSADAETTLKNGIDKKCSSLFKPFSTYSPPKPIQRYFSGWAKRYILKSPLHPSQKLIDPMVDADNLHKLGPEGSQANKPTEIGLFEFTVWNTVDFEFRVASFREWSWPVENVSEGPPQEQNINLKNITKILNELAFKFNPNSLPGPKGLRLLMDDILLNVEKNMISNKIQEDLVSRIPIMDTKASTKTTDSSKRSIFIKTNLNGQKSIKAGNGANRYNVAWAQQYRNFWWLSFKSPKNDHDPFFFYMRGDIINQLGESNLMNFWAQAVGPRMVLPNGQGMNYEAHLKFKSFEDILEFLGHFYEVNFCKY